MAAVLKFMFSKKASKMTKSSPSIWQLLHTVKLKVKILSFFVAFSENVNFTIVEVIKGSIMTTFWLLQ